MWKKEVILSWKSLENYSQITVPALDLTYSACCNTKISRYVLSNSCGRIVEETRWLVTGIWQWVHC